MLSSAAAEYYEVSEACREIAFVRGILSDFYGKDENDPLVPTPLMIHNQSAIAMGQMPQFTEKQKHIPICMCHLKECCAEGLVQLYPMSTKNELADIGTKALERVCCLLVLNLVSSTLMKTRSCVSSLSSQEM